LSDNIINLDAYRQSLEILDDYELQDSLIIGWAMDSNGDKILHVSSSTDTKESLWMIELAKKIIESRPPDCRNSNE
tara:strand:+ start:682 stop:909 length:228 start_codon:yes stop_codon:yes gene_type:complete